MGVRWRPCGVYQGNRNAMRNAGLATWLVAVAA